MHITRLIFIKPLQIAHQASDSFFDDMDNTHLNAEKLCENSYDGVF